MIRLPGGFTGSPLDRLEAVRIDPQATAALAARPDARLLLLDAYTPRLDEGALAWEPLGPDLSPETLVLLGCLDGTPRFARLDPDAGPARRSNALMALLDTLPEGEAATYAAARSLLDWHSRHRFCANCGQMSHPIRAGWARRCPSCGTEHFPRTDPVVIMLAEHVDEAGVARVLIGRQPMFPPGRYSALAGFVEVGEALEEAVVRELWEEAGVRARSVRYLTSQPWPFPSQLMLACIAGVDDPALTLDQNELEHAFWVTADDVAAALGEEAGACFLPPPRYAIAHTLFQAWLAEQRQG